MKKPLLIGYSLAGLSAICGAIFPFFMDVLQEETPNAAVASFAFFGMGMFYSSLGTLNKRSFRTLRHVRGKWLWLIVLLGMIGIVGNMLNIAALEYIDPPILQTLSRTEIVFSVLFSTLILHERFYAYLLVGILCVMIGAPLLYLDQAAVGTLPWRWMFLPIGGAACFALLSVIFRVLLSHFNASFLNVTRLFFSVTLLLFIPGIFSDIASLTLRAWFIAAIAGFLGPFLSRMCFSRASLHLPVPNVTMILSFSPVLSFFIQFLRTGEIPTLHEVMGLSLIVLGVMYIVIVHARSLRTGIRVGTPLKPSE